MATARLIPSTSAVSNSSYASISNASNMYENTDSTTHGTFTHNRASTSNTYYGYLRGFNFSAIPSNAIVNSFTVKIKASATGHTASTSSSYYMSLINNTTQIGSTSASGRLSTTVTTFTFANGSLDWDTIKGYGSNFGIRIPMRRASSDTADVVSVYGAEIEVDYTVPNPATVTTTLSGNGTISPSGATSTYDGEEFELTITPTNKTDTVTATNNGVDITSQLVAHGSEASANRVLGTYSLISGGFNGSGATYFSGLVGKGVDNTKTTSNYYSSGSSTHAVFQYDMSFDIPSTANVTRVWCEVNGHAESTSQASEYMCVQLESGGVDMSDEINFKSIGTSNTTVTLEVDLDSLDDIPELLGDMVLKCTLGYYGGAINGATCYVEYEIGSGTDHYTYTYIVSGDATIAVVIGGSTQQPRLYVKINGTIKEVIAGYVGVNGVPVQRSLDQLFDSSKKYRYGG